MTLFNPRLGTRRPVPLTGFSAARNYTLLLPLIFCAPAYAEPPPDAGLILKETRPQQQPPPATAIPPIKAPPPAPSHPPLPAARDDVRVKVSHFTFSGNSALSTDILNSTVAEWAGRSLDFGELMQVVEKIEARYREAGFFLAQAYLPPQMRARLPGSCSGRQRLACGRTGDCRHSRHQPER